MISQQVRAGFARDPVALTVLVVILIFVALAIIGPVIAPYDPTVINRGLDGEILSHKLPSKAHPFGTTDLGRDILSQTLTGTRPVMIIGLSCALIINLIGTILGIISGYFGGHVDNLLQRLVELAYALPTEALAIVILSFMKPGMLPIILVIVLLSWRLPMRVIRTQTLTLRERSFVKAAQICGVSDTKILIRHILPNVLPISLIYIPITFGNAILTEASISFLGFGPPEMQSWGQMIRAAFNQGALYNAWWWFVAPGFCMTVLIAATFLVSRPFEEILNPKLRSHN